MTSYLDWIHKKLSRVTRSGEVIQEIDGLRFVAIMAVILYHIRPYVLEKSQIVFQPTIIDSVFEQVISRGFIGVQLFFVISGFVLSLPFARAAFLTSNHVNLREYFLRRLTRLEPPYIINLILIFGLLIVAKGVSYGQLLPHLLASFFYIHNLVFSDVSLINTVAWSLEIEVQFYVLMPVISRIFYISNFKFRFFWYLVIFLVSCAVSSFAIGPRSSLTLFSQFQFFLTGMILSDLYLHNYLESKFRVLSWDLLGFFGWVAIIPMLSMQNKIPAKFLIPGLVMLAYVAAFRGLISNCIFRNRWVVVIGGMCYTIYLYHHFVISLIGKLTIKVARGNSFALNFIGQAVVMVPIILLTCSIIFCFTEKPFMARWWKSKN